MDVYRQPKYSYYMFMSQRSPQKQEQRLYENGPMVYIAHEMPPFSSKDVTVYSNCDEIRLTFLKDGKTQTYTRKNEEEGMPSPIITFKDAYNFMEKLLLWVDNQGMDLKANGSDFVTVVAAVADKAGNIKRLNNYSIKFHIEGEGRILGESSIGANSVPVRWGTAPVLIQSTLTPGKIKITASVLIEGSQMPMGALLEFESKPGAQVAIYNPDEAALLPMTFERGAQHTTAKTAAELEKDKLQKEQNAIKLKEVEKQQAEFGEKK